MKKSLYISGLALMLAGMSFTSCSDFLDADNKTTANKGADDALVNQPDGLLMEAYASIYEFARTSVDIAINDEGTDLYIPVRGKNPSDIDKYTLSASNDEVYTYWKKVYTMINNANAVVYYNNQKVKNASYDAEAKFLRNWGYYLLTQQYGDVPYVTEYISTPNGSYPRVAVATIYDSCIKELKAVYEAGALPASKGTNLAQPTQAACAALLSKFYLAKAWDCYVTEEGSSVDPSKVSADGKTAFNEAASWAEKALGISAGAAPANLPLTFADKWSPANDNNTEVIWAIQSNGAAELGAHVLANEYGNYYGDQAKTGYKQVGSLHAQSNKSLYLFAKGDSRYEATFMTAIRYKDYFAYYNGGTTKIGFQYFPYYVTESDAISEMGKNASNYATGETKAFILANTCTSFEFDASGKASVGEKESYSDLYSQTVGSGVCVKKYDDPVYTKSGAGYRCVPIFHSSDIYLTAAEAYYMAGNDSKALEYVNKVRYRAYDNTNSGELADFTETEYKKFYEYEAPEGGFKPIDIILDERARELYAERTRWIDLRRTNQLERYNVKYNVNLNSKVKDLRPIPTNEMGANTGITYQNEGY